MCKVEPIRDKQKIEDMKATLLKRGYRDYMLFVFGINTGLRISDILKLKVKDVQDKTHISLIEGKTDKQKRFKINEQLREEINSYIKGMDPDSFLFESQRSDKNGNKKAISRVQAYRILTEAGQENELEEVGTHTLRKTFGYWHYNQYKDVAMLQKLFNHSSPSVTLEYIGINQDVMDESIDNFYL